MEHRCSTPYAAPGNVRSPMAFSRTARTGANRSAVPGPEGATSSDAMATEYRERRAADVSVVTKNLFLTQSGRPADILLRIRNRKDWRGAVGRRSQTVWSVSMRRRSGNSQSCIVAVCEREGCESEPEPLPHRAHQQSWLSPWRSDRDDVPRPPPPAPGTGLHPTGAFP